MGDLDKKLSTIDRKYRIAKAAQITTYSATGIFTASAVASTVMANYSADNRLFGLCAMALTFTGLAIASYAGSSFAEKAQIRYEREKSEAFLEEFPYFKQLSGI